MTDDEVYFNAIMKQRVMRKTHDPKKLHQIYANKSSNWIVPFFKEHNVSNIPVIFICNTLFKLPDYFSIGEKSAFIFDYYLYDYLYDLNYILLKLENREFMVNLYIKTYIENLYLNKQFDDCYWFCVNTVDIESFKNQQEYEDKLISYHLVELTDIQEAVIFLHEASHFIFENYSEKLKESERYQRILKMYYVNLKTHETEKSIFGMVHDPNFNLDKFLEECYCDSESVYFVMKRIGFNSVINIEEVFNQLFRTIMSMYFLHFVIASKGKYAEVYNDHYMQQLQYRLANINATILSFLLEYERNNEIEILGTVYEKQIEEFNECGETIRQIFKIVEKDISSVLEKKSINGDNIHKQTVMKEYLKLL